MKISANFIRWSYYELAYGCVASFPSKTSRACQFGLEIWVGPEHPFDLPVLEAEGFVFPNDNRFAALSEECLGSGCISAAVCGKVGKAEEIYLWPDSFPDGRIAVLSNFDIQDGYGGTEVIITALRAVQSVLRQEYPELRGLLASVELPNSAKGKALLMDLRRAGFKAVTHPGTGAAVLYSESAWPKEDGGKKK